MAPDRNGGALRELEPPPGGIKRFEQRLDRVDHSSGMRIGTALVAGVAVSVLAIVIIGLLRQPGTIEPDTPSVYEAPAFDRLLGRPMQQAGTSVSIDDEPVSVSVLAGADSNIRIYGIESD